MKAYRTPKDIKNLDYLFGFELLKQKSIDSKTKTTFITTAQQHQIMQQ